MGKTHRYTVEEVEDILKRINIKLISKSYKNSRTEIEIEFSCGHKTNATLDSLNRGKKCSICRNKSGRKFQPIEVVEKRLYDSHNGSVTMKNYINQSSKADFKCSICNYEWTGFSNQVISGKCGCPNCKNKRIAKFFRMTDEEVDDYVESQNCQWVDGEYISGKIKIKIKFDCGHEGWIPLDSFKLGKICVWISM